MQNEHENDHQPGRHELLFSLVLTGMALAVLIALGHLTSSSLLALVY